MHPNNLRILDARDAALRAVFALALIRLRYLLRDLLVTMFRLAQELVALPIVILVTYVAHTRELLRPYGHAAHRVFANVELTGLIIEHVQALFRAETDAIWDAANDPAELEWLARDPDYDDYDDYGAYNSD